MKYEDELRKLSPEVQRELAQMAHDLEKSRVLLRAADPLLVKARDFEQELGTLLTLALGNAKMSKRTLLDGVRELARERDLMKASLVTVLRKMQEPQFLDLLVNDNDLKQMLHRFMEEIDG